MTSGAILVDCASALFAEWQGELPVDVAPVLGDGTARSYLRLSASDGTTAIGAHGPDREENQAFFSYSRTFRSLGLPVPELYQVDVDNGIWLLEDLGDVTLFDMIKEMREPGSDAFPEAVMPIYRKVLEVLPRFQVEGGRAINFKRAYPRGAFDQQSILWDLNYFKYHFLKLAHVRFNEARLEQDFSTLTRFLLKGDTSHFLYRDFQSRNVMIRGSGERVSPWFIDYQGGRRGALPYDVASLLYDAKANLPDLHRATLLDHYLEAVVEHHPVNRDEFLELWPGYVLVRTLQALGAYGYRGFFERKPGFLQSVPYAAENLRGLLTAGFTFEVPELEATLTEIANRWGSSVDAPPSQEGLEVSISSFRFAGGYPQDTTGHGGGHVFDCRGLPNPGRQQEYRRLTGLDQETIEFLAAQPETVEFWTQVRGIVDAHVTSYVDRGFHSLAVHFGCTGGQHRSVYMAERLAVHLRSLYPQVHVSVIHRERADWPRKHVSG